MTTTNLRRVCVKGAMAAAVLLASTAAASAASPEAHYLDRPPEDEIIYFALPDRFENADPSNDRGGLAGDRLVHGFDPSHKGFYHGGDLKGLTERLDYIEALGASAIWLGPIYKNKPVQGPSGNESAGYHGYWITDFTTVDRHFGTEDELKAFVDAAHARGMKIYLDIITNHTADVIAYRECHDPDYKGPDAAPGCPYRPTHDYPYTTRGGVNGAALNKGFLGDRAAYQTTENFRHLVRPDFAYTPFVRDAEKTVKVPAWLNDPIYYHNRSDSVWEGESITYGDFFGLDDLMTEHPHVVAGMIDIFKDWISTYKIDGFRVDTARHVNPEFWQAFVPAMLDHARAEGIPNFYIFGEAASFTTAELARHTTVDGFPYVLDFVFQKAVQSVLADGAPTARLAEFFALDVLYRDGEATARGLPVFVGNHDMGRFAMFARQANPGIGDAELLKRIELAHAMMMFMRGVPVIYYGDEQGFNGDGNDQASREDMFASVTASYNDNDLVGTQSTTAISNFDTGHPLFRAIADMSAIYHGHEALRRGAQIVRHSEIDGGVFALSRSNDAGGEYLVIFNASNDAREANIETDPRSTDWQAVTGSCPASPRTTGIVTVSLPAWGYVICQSNTWKKAP